MICLAQKQRSPILRKLIQQGDRTANLVTLSKVSDRISSAKQSKEGSKFWDTTMCIVMKRWAFKQIFVDHKLDDTSNSTDGKNLERVQLFQVCSITIRHDVIYSENFSYI
jgi:hypothetical protein